MVSPPDKNLGNVPQGGQVTVGFSRDGQSAGFCSSALFGDPPPQQVFTCAPYVSVRSGDGPTGWETSSPFPKICKQDPDGPLQLRAGERLPAAREL